jgi:hypothetical protein
MSSQQKLEMRTRARECFLHNFEIHEAASSLIRTLSFFTAGGAVHSNV